MNKKIIHSRKLIFFLIQMCINILFSYYISRGSVNESLLFFLTIVIGVLIIAIAKFSIISLITITIIYPLIAVYYQKTTGFSYGILQLSVEKLGMQLYFYQIVIICCLSLLMLLTFVISTSFLELEKVQLRGQLILTKKGVYFCAILALLASVIAFPQVPFSFSSEDRFAALLPGHAWNHLALLSILILIISVHEKNIIIKPTIVFVVFWFLAHFERVDIIGFILGYFVIFVIRNNVKIRIKKIFLIILTVTLCLYVFVYIGEVRNGTKNITLSYLSQKLLVQNTASDVAYTFNCSIDYVRNSGYLYGKTLVYYIYNVVPILNAPNSAASVLSSNYAYPGGIFIFSEMYMNFGILGVFIGNMLLLFLLYFFAYLHSNYGRVAFAFLLITIIRLCWYGISYDTMALLYFLPFILMIFNIPKMKGSL